MMYGIIFISVIIVLTSCACILGLTKHQLRVVFALYQTVYVYGVCLTYAVFWFASQSEPNFIFRFPIQKSPRSSAQGIIRQLIHYDDVIMRGIASQSTSLMIVYSTVYSSADQRKHQSSASLAFVWGIHRDRWIHRTKGQLRGKCFHLMTSSWSDRPCLCLHSYQNSYQECYPINQIWNINCYNTLLM